MYNETYVEQVKLLLRCLPALSDSTTFALKGGTAINLFFRGLPRLSVDIDLTYVSIATREKSLREIQSGLKVLKETIEQRNQLVRVYEQRSPKNNQILKLLVKHQNVTIKIEPNFILRGTLFPVEQHTLHKAVIEQFGLFIDRVPILCKEEVFAGKICAALNRQHPRDLFDIKYLLEHEGITDKIRQAFVIYLASNPRPIHELLMPNLLNIEQLYEKEFKFMTKESVELKHLLMARDELIKSINTSLTEQEKNFLISIKIGEPEYHFMPFKNLDKLPAIQWKLFNILQMEKKKHQMMLKKLKEVLEK